MRRLLLVIITICFLTPSIFGEETYYTPEKAKVFLKYMVEACYGKNACYYNAKERFENDEDLGSIVYFACKTEYARYSRIDLGHDKFLGCMRRGTKALIKYYNEVGDTDTADYLRPWISDCETRSSVTGRFECYRAYLRDGEGKYN